MGHLQLYNRAGSFKEILIYCETTIEWSLESLAEEAIKGIPNGLFSVSGNTESGYARCLS